MYAIVNDCPIGDDEHFCLLKDITHEPKYHFYRPSTKLREVSVCHSVRGGGIPYDNYP